jgi:hypothetical protein
MVMGVSQLVAWRQLVREAVDSLMNTGGWRPSGRLEMSLQLLRTPDGAVRRLFASDNRRRGQNWRVVTVMVLAALLERAGDQLRRCVSCDQIMVRRGRREYCSNACSQRIRSARHYQVHREQLLERKAEHYQEHRDTIRQQKKERYRRLPVAERASLSQHARERRLLRIATEVEPPRVKVQRRGPHSRRTH